MARITIVPADGTVIVDSILKYQPLDLSGCGVPENVHALQWYENRGWVEFVDSIDPAIPKAANQEIMELPAWANACVAVHTNWTPISAPVFEPQVVPTIPTTEFVGGV